MGAIIKREIYFLLKNPITYLAILLMFAIVTITVRPYLSIYDNLRNENEPVKYDSEGDIDTGYIPTPIEEWYTVSMAELKESLINDIGISAENAEKEIKTIIRNKWKIDEISNYMKKKYSINGVESTFAVHEYKQATYKEMEKYLESSFKHKTYTQSLAYKYSDFLSIGSILATIVIFILLLSRDMKKDVYSLLHTKPLKKGNYVIGKLVSGSIVLYTSIMLLTFTMDIIAVKKGVELGLKTNPLDIWKSVVMFNLPNIILTACIVIFITLLFKNILPCIPVMLLYFLYSNMGSVTSAHEYIYAIKPFVLLIRFPGNFAKLTIPKGAILNQCLVVIFSIILLVSCIALWERRRSV